MLVQCSIEERRFLNRLTLASTLTCLFLRNNDGGKKLLDFGDQLQQAETKIFLVGQRALSEYLHERQLMHELCARYVSYVSYL